jgi:hypothetical protein
MSDDFFNDGGVLDRTKWVTIPHPNHGDRVNCVFNYTDAANPVDSEGLHIKTTHTSGVNWDIGNMVLGRFRTPPNYYIIIWSSGGGRTSAAQPTRISGLGAIAAKTILVR